MIVVKFGGHAMSDEDGIFAHAIADAISSGVQIVIVHGGGPHIDRALHSAGITSQFLGGFRVTTPEIYAVVERVLAHEVGPALTHTLQRKGVNAVATSGKSSGALTAKPLKTLVNGAPADLGLVGEIESVDAQPILALLHEGKVPVIAPIAADHTRTGGLNVNADLAAAALAGALHAEALIIMTDVAGIYRNWPDRNSLIDVISATELFAMKSSFSEGMAPKVQACLDAISAGAKNVRIIDGKDPLSFAQALHGEGGTLVCT